MRSLLPLLLVASIAGLSGTARGDFTEYEDRPLLEPGGDEVNSLPEAAPVPFDGADFLAAYPEGVKLVRGSLDAADIDAYAVSLTSGDLLLGALFDDEGGARLDLGLGVFADALTPPLALDDDGGRGFHAQLGHVAAAGGSVLLGVTGFGDEAFDGSHDEALAAIAPYRLLLGVARDPASLQESDLDPGPQGSNDSIATADLLPAIGGLVRASLPPGDVDYFAIELEEGDRIDAAVFDLAEAGLGFGRGVFEDAIIGLVDPWGTPRGRDDDAGPGFGPRLSFEVPAGRGGRWVLAVSGFDDAAFTGAHDEGPVAYALLVARDRACPNAVPVMSAVSASTALDYELARLEGGDHYYTDRSMAQKHVLVDVPPSLECAQWVKTPNEDKNIDVFPHLTITLDEAASLYIAYDSTALAEPAWLAGGFTPLPLVVDIADPNASQEYDVLRRDFPAGTVELGGNEAPGANSNYVVLALPLDTSDPGQAVPIPAPVLTGTASIVVSGVWIEVPTFSWQSPAEVAQALADAVNADPDLAAARVYAVASGDVLVTTGSVDEVGLFEVNVPSLSPPFLVLLAALLVGLAVPMLRRAAAA